MTTRTRRLAREAALTLGAVLGVLCLTTALAAPLLGMKLLVFKSGSMGPDMDTGAVGISRTVDADDLHSGDVVSVTTSEGTRVTHRIIDIVRDGDQAVLELKGDANAEPDSETYAVTEADRLVAHVNGLGYVVDAMASPYAVFLAGAGAAGLMVITFRRRADSEADADDADDDAADDDTDTDADGGTVQAPAGAGPGRRVTVAAGLAVAALAAGIVTLGPTTLTPTLAAFSDTAKVEAPASAATVPSPAGNVGCVNGAVFSGQVHVDWTAVANPPPGYHYRVEVSKDGESDPVRTYTTTGQTQTIGFGEVNHGSGTYQVRVSGAIDGSTWHSAEGITRTIWVGSSYLNFDCGS